MVGAPQRRTVARYLMSHYDCSERHVCRVVGQSRSALHYVSRRRPDTALVQRIQELATTRVRYGYKRIHVLLKREGYCVNHKRVHRIYCNLGLQLRAKRPRRHVSALHREQPSVQVKSLNQAWSMDFVSDQLQAGQHFRVFTLIDVYSRECLALVAGMRLAAGQVVATLDQVARQRGVPCCIYCDNGSEFCSQLVDLWAYHHHVTLAFSRPGKPTDHAHIESFNGSLRDECLNIHWFSSLTDAQEKLDAWRRDYNETRPHRALDNLAPCVYAAQWKQEPRNSLCNWT